MARATMADLIDKVQELIADPSASTWTEDQVEAALDSGRVHHHNHELRYQTRTLPGNALAYKDYFSQYRWWESDGVLRDPAGSTLSPDVGTTDWLLGFWFFGASQPPPVYIDGKTYDPYSAAALLLREHAAKLKLEFDFTDGGVGVGKKQASLSQRYNQMLALAREYDQKSKGRRAPNTRGDANARI